MNKKTEKHIRQLLDRRQPLPFALAIVLWQEIETLRKSAHAAPEQE